MCPCPCGSVLLFHPQQAKKLAESIDRNGNGSIEKSELLAYFRLQPKAQQDIMITKHLMSCEQNRIALLLQALGSRIDSSYRHVPDEQKEIAKSEVLG